MIHFFECHHDRCPLNLVASLELVVLLICLCTVICGQLVHTAVGPNLLRCNCCNGLISLNWCLILSCVRCRWLSLIKLSHLVHISNEGLPFTVLHLSTFMWFCDVLVLGQGWCCDRHLTIVVLTRHLRHRLINRWCQSLRLCMVDILGLLGH